MLKSGPPGCRVDRCIGLDDIGVAEHPPSVDAWAIVLPDETIPTVIVPFKPNGFPIATTVCPTCNLPESPMANGWSSLCRCVHFYDGDICVTIGTDPVPGLITEANPFTSLAPPHAGW
jgi:hypothetical protein